MLKFKLRRRPLVAATLLSLLTMLPLSMLSQEPGRLKAGAKVPAFSLRDQSGKQQDLSSLSGPNGLLLLFFRSADWCPFCKGQLVDLSSTQKAFAAKGIHVAAVSYDSPAILADFAKRRGIDFPLLSDSNSAVIDKFGIRNPDGNGMQAGIPYPGFYLIDPKGIIQQRFFESAYVNRITSNNIYEHLFGNFALALPATQLNDTPHVTVTTTQSDAEVTPGALVELLVKLTPGPDTHVYAPGAEKLNYHVVSLTVPPSNLYSATATNYPKSELLEFPTLKETVPVYTGPIVLNASVATIVNQTTLPLFSQNPHVVVKGELEYQACTSTVCYPPVKTPVQWAFNLKPLDRERSPKEIQHK